MDTKKVSAYFNATTRFGREIRRCDVLLRQRTEALRCGRAGGPHARSLLVAELAALDLMAEAQRGILDALRDTRDALSDLLAPE